MPCTRSTAGPRPRTVYATCQPRHPNQRSSPPMRFSSSGMSFFASTLYAAAPAIAAAPPPNSTFRHRIALVLLVVQRAAMLLEARKTAPLERLYAAYGRRLLRRAFAGV